MATLGFMWLTAEQYAKYMSNTQMTTIPGKSMLPTWSHWIVATTLHDACTTAAYQVSYGQHELTFRDRFQDRRGQYELRHHR